MTQADRVRLRHMIEAAREAIAFARGRTPSELAAERILLLALVRLVEIIGEAASRLTAETRASSPEVPWVDISMRRRLVHACFDVDSRLVADAVAIDLPVLVTALEAVESRG